MSGLCNGNVSYLHGMIVTLRDVFIQGASIATMRGTYDVDEDMIRSNPQGSKDHGLGGNGEARIPVG
nr:hypothetical protein [Tanacetum cinerariifolium]